MGKHFVPARRPMLYPLGRGVHFRMASQIEFYERLTDPKFDLRDVAAVTEPFIIKSEASKADSALARAVEVWVAISNCLILSS